MIKNGVVEEATGNESKRDGRRQWQLGIFNNLL
jgi:hypothetical protein